MHISDVIWHSFAARFLGLEAGRHPLPGSRSRWPLDAADSLLLCRHRILLFGQSCTYLCPLWRHF